jgi:glycosyltransferase involved in cell wall biosynthesis
MKKNLVLFIPSIEDGGVEKNLFIVANYLSKKIDNIEIITCNNNFKNKFNNHIRFIGTRNKFWNNCNKKIKYTICLLILFKKLLFKKEKMLVFAFQANIYTIIISKIFNTKVVTRSNTSILGWSKNKIKLFFYRLFLNLADDIIVNSKLFQKEFLKKFNIKVKYIYNPFDKNVVRTNISKNKKIHFFKKDTLNLLSIGRLTDQKDQLTLLKSMKLVDAKLKPRLVVIGRGKNFYALEKYAREKNMQKYIKFTGYLKNPYHYIKKAKILILTSKFEGLPNILIEAQFFKKYIISTDCPTGPKEILLNGLAGDLIKIGDYKKLAFLINNYYKNKKDILKKINTGSKYFNRFDYQKNCKEYLNFVLNNF